MRREYQTTGTKARKSCRRSKRREPGNQFTERRRSRTYPAWGYHASPVLKTGWATGPVPLRAKRSSGGPGPAAQHTLVADASGEAVGVEAFEEQLSRFAARSEQVAEASKGDRACGLAFLE
jgi:hypothetical protein